MTTQKRSFLAELSWRVAQDQLLPSDREYLATCLKAISEGQNPSDVFKMAKSKGASPARDAAIIRNNNAITLIAALTRPRYKNESDFSLSTPSGEGLSPREAIAIVAELSGIDETNLERYWNKAKQKKSNLLTSHFEIRNLLPK